MSRFSWVRPRFGWFPRPSPSPGPPPSPEPPFNQTSAGPPPTLRGPTLRAPALRGPHPPLPPPFGALFPGLGPHPSGPQQFGVGPRPLHPDRPPPKPPWPPRDLEKIRRHVGLERCWPKNGLTQTGSLPQFPQRRMKRKNSNK